MLEELKRIVCEANLRLVREGLVLFTWGNVSGIDREKGLVVIKPSGVDYDGMRPEDMTVVRMDGSVAEGRYRPSSDTPTHLELYRAFPSIGGVVHTHSTEAVARAQAGMSLPCYGTTHADYFHGTIPCTRDLTPDEVREAYERSTGLVIAETFRGLDENAIPGVLCRSHGPFTWGSTPDQAVFHARVLEEVARMARLTESLRPAAPTAPDYVIEKHYLRKHGPGAYYGQAPHA